MENYKKLYEKYGITVDDTNCDEVIFYNDKTEADLIRITEGCLDDSRNIVVEVYADQETFDYSKEWIIEDIFENPKIDVYVIKDTMENNFSGIDLFNYIKTLFELHSTVSKEEFINVLEDLDCY